MVVPEKKRKKKGKTNLNRSLGASSRIILIFWAFNREIDKETSSMKIKNRVKIIN